MTTRSVKIMKHIWRYSISLYIHRDILLSALPVCRKNLREGRADAAAMQINMLYPPVLHPPRTG